MPKVETTVLCEDMNHFAFVRSYLTARGYNGRQIRHVDVPAGEGSGAQHVLNHYAREVRLYRRVANHIQSRCLVVVIDGDTIMGNDQMSNRHHQLEQALTDAGEPPRGPSERIAVLVPCRNIETWARVLLGGDVQDEFVDYKAQVTRGDCSNAGTQMLIFCQGGLAGLPSLLAACLELQRLP